MTSVERLERLLIDDLEQLGDRLADDRLCRDLYRTLTNRALCKRAPDADGHLVLSWGRAEEILNGVRANRSEPTLERLAHSGGEGELSERAVDALADLGWQVDAMSTSRADDRHSGRAASAPPAGQGEAQAPVDDAGAWGREAHAEAEDTRRRRRPVRRGGQPS